MVHTSLSGRYLGGPHGSYKSQWKVPCRASWFTQVSVTGTLQGPMVHTSLSGSTLEGPLACTGVNDRYFAGPHGLYKSQ